MNQNRPVQPITPQDRQTQPHMLVRRSIALVLAGGRGSRLKQLTDKRAKPAVISAASSASSTSRCPTASTPASAASA
jgi:ADP-glucose pyrophosphorylase